MPSRDGEGQALLEEPANLADHVLVARLGLHRARLAAHVGEAAVRARVGHHPGQFRGEAERRDVVDERRPRRERRLGDLALGRVDRDPVAGAGEPLDDRNRARQLVRDRDRLGAGTGGRPAHVEDVGALSGEALAVLDRRVGVEEEAAVRERVGRRR